MPPELYSYAAPFGDPVWVTRDVTAIKTRTWWRDVSYNVGGGRAMGDSSLASLVAIAEAAERYASELWASAPVIWESGSGLGRAALDLDAIPRCSGRELASGTCALRAPAKDLPIRWVTGFELGARREVWVPAIMVYYGFPPERLAPGERFWHQISTGCAVHTSRRRALVAAICEVIERDAIALTWLQRLRLPPLDPAVLSGQAATLIDWNKRRFLATHLFDATTDLGVPTAYCLQVAPHAQRAAQVVGCATGMTMAEAAEKALLETMTTRSALSRVDPASIKREEIRTLTDGAAYMGQPDMLPAFQFLLGSPGLKESPAESTFPEGEEQVLDSLMSILQASGMSAIAVDLTTDELADVGLTAVHVIIPELQPMSLVPSAQYLGHPRLYSAPTLMGHPSSPEEGLNPWPQPFA
jgi:ribosomal protein S12 methylthiotransferase accessory factor